VGRELALVVAGVAAMALGALALVEGIRRISDVESTQTRLGLVVVGFATAFELVVLAWSSARRGATTAVVAAVVGSFTYNVTMTLGAGALARPLQVVDAAQLRGPWLAMLAALALVPALAWRSQQLGRTAGLLCLALYPAFVAVVLVS
jgi:cation:H+ antiporter